MKHTFIILYKRYSSYCRISMFLLANIHSLLAFFYQKESPIKSQPSPRQPLNQTGLPDNLIDAYTVLNSFHQNNTVSVTLKKSLAFTTMHYTDDYSSQTYTRLCIEHKMNKSWTRVAILLCFTSSVDLYRYYLMHCHTYYNVLLYTLTCTRVVTVHKEILFEYVGY